MEDQVLLTHRPIKKIQLVSIACVVHKRISFFSGKSYFGCSKKRFESDIPLSDMNNVPDDLSVEMLYTPQTELPNDDTLYALLDLLHDEWVRTDITSGDDLVSWACERFEVLTTQVTFNQLHDKSNKRMMQLVQLDRMFKNREELLSGDAVILEKIARIAHVIRQCMVIVESAASLFYHLDPAREMLLPKEWKIDNIFCNGLDEKCSSFQSLLLFVLKKLATAEFRKLDGFCYEQVKTADGDRTHAWVRGDSLETFVYKVVQKDPDRDQWMNLTNPRDNGQAVIKHIKEARNIEFPDLLVNRYIFAYTNGLYNIDTDMFYPFDMQPDWSDMAEEITTFRRNHGWSDTYTAISPTESDVAVQFLNQPFRFAITPETEKDFDPDLIILPELDTILNSQKLDDGTKRWVLLMLCRLFFPVGYDGWQVMLFIKGMAGSGKSTIAKFIRSFFESTMVTTMSSNMEGKFGLSSIYKGLICVCAEVRADFGMDQGSWQSAVSGEEVSIMVKNQTAFSHKWDTPLFFLGNELPNYPNSSGSVDRRLFMIEVGHLIAASDPHLYSKLEKNADNFQRKGVSYYHAACREFGNTDIWDIPALPEQIMEFRATMRASVDCLFSFVKDETTFRFHPTFFMPMKDFRDMYTEYRKELGYTTQIWKKEVYTQVFQGIGLIITRTAEERIYRNSKISDIWIGGIDLMTVDS